MAVPTVAEIFVLDTFTEKITPAEGSKLEEGIAVEGVFVAKGFLQVFCKKTIRIDIDGLPPILNTVHFEKRLSTIDTDTAKKITEAMQALRRYAQVG